MILGDFNLCYKEQRMHSVFQFLQNSNFQQVIERPTHTEGRIIDLIFVRNNKRKLIIDQKAQYFTDHDLLEIS